MTPIISLTELKAQLRIEPDFAEENDYLESLIEQAQAHCEDICRKEFTDTVSSPAPPAVKAAVLMLATHLYENRGNEEKQTWLSVSMGIDRLLEPHRDPAKMY